MPLQFFVTRLLSNSSSSSKRVFHRVLIANRGEIAVRVMKTCRRLGIRSIGVYSTADAKSFHVESADESYCIGPPAPQQSYLNQKKLIEICRKSGAEAVHPGYGFLSENAEFSDLCQQNNLIFIGPSGQAMRSMGLKSLSKRIMIKAGVPVIPGYHGDDQNDARLEAEADKIGYPVMIKAIRGGGGKGMRISMTQRDFKSQLQSARREAINSFGDDAMLLERYIEKPRHVEVQIFGDSHLNYVYLWERDCSLQRRHQKIIEEAPAPGISPETRMALGEAACSAARAVGYVGAGTVEFILDSDGKSFYFMEMNTRLQVEHPVTEMITNQDLVEWQIRVAQGEKLPLLGQSDIPFHGHAFEARLYAEDANFMPSPGPIRHLAFPKNHAEFTSLMMDKSSQCRVDSGVRQGDQVSIHYDPMIAKLIVWGPDRASALRRLVSALIDTHVVGLPTNVNFLLKMATNKAFEEGHVHTGFIAEQKDKFCEKSASVIMTTESLMQAAIVMIVDERSTMTRQHGVDSAATLAFGFRPNSTLKRTLTFTLDGDDQSKTETSVNIEYLSQSRFRLSIDGAAGRAAVSTVVSLNSTSTNHNNGELNISYVCDDSRTFTYSAIIVDGDIYLFQQGGVQSACIKVPKYTHSTLAGGSAAYGAGSSGPRVTSPISGVVNRILVKPGDMVKKGESLLVLIAMKMEYVIRAPRDGTIRLIHFAPGQTVQKDVDLAIFADENNGTTSNNNV